ncbi:U5 small nuclear ribonucleoprotein TSSC4 [Hemitrygon akajei]|uniref:U5 small nuclear ribonucleoprotein TSSC4 n=1 Tax=Hemitrygon akajei TaxID=2704970 RepID=UPI003BF9C169
MVDEETSTDLLLLTDPNHETRLFNDVISIGETDSENNPQSLNSISHVDESDPGDWELDDSLVEPQCDYMSDHSLITGNSPPLQLFQLRGASSGFTSRSHSIFSGLENAVKLDASQSKDKKIIEGEFKHPPYQAPQEKLTEGSPSEKMIVMVPARARQSTVLCKKPHSVPDFLLHPERWTKYSLEDVPEMSNKKNTAVALEFMGVLKKRKKEKNTDMQQDLTEDLTDFNESSSSCFNQKSDSGVGKIVFRKPSKPEVTEWDSPDKKVDVIKKREKSGELSSVDLALSDCSEVQDAEAWWHDKDVAELSKDRKQITAEEKEQNSVIFHNVRKRNRKNIRMKLNEDSEDD